MKKVFRYFLAVLLVAGSTACNPKGPENDTSAPIISGENNQSINVKVDDSDFYQVVRTITSTTGVSKIVLKAYTEVINTQTEFKDSKNVNYTFDIDLTELTFDNGIAISEYAIEATDVNGKVAAQKLTLTVREGSVMMIGFPTTGDLETPFEDYTVKFKVFKGQGALTKIDVSVDDNHQTIDMSDSTVKSEYDMAVLVRGLVGGSNTVTIVLTNDRNGSVEATKNIIRKPAKIWKDLAWTDGQGPAGGIRYNRDINFSDIGSGQEITGIHDIRLNFRYRFGKEDAFLITDFSKLYRIDMRTTAGTIEYYNGYDLAYNANDLVNKVTRWRVVNSENGAKIDSTVYIYTYNGNNQVTKVTKGDNGASATDYLTDFVYNNDEVVSYRISGTPYIPTYVEINGERVRADHMTGPVSSGKTYTFSNEDVNPVYLSFLPAVVPLMFSGDLLVDGENLTFSQLFYNKYLVKSISSGPSFKIVPTEMTEKTGTWPMDGSINAGKSYTNISSTQNVPFSDMGKDKFISYIAFKRVFNN